MRNFTSKQNDNYFKFKKKKAVLKELIIPDSFNILNYKLMESKIKKIKPKMVFDLPLEYWLKDDLKPWAEDLLNEDDIKNQGLLNYKYVKTIWSEFLNGHPNWFRVWNMITFQLWMRNNNIDN